MNRDINPGAVEEQLRDLARALDDNAADLADLDEKAVRARHEYLIAYARALLSADAKSAEQRKARADLATDESRLNAEIAEQKVRAAKEKQRTIATRIDVGRSIGAGLRATWAAAS